jgi:hypothetical protein
MMAKSWKSTWACSMNWVRSARHRRERAVAHGRRSVSEPLEHGVDVERVGHGPDPSDRWVAYRPPMLGRVASQ